MSVAATALAPGMRITGAFMQITKFMKLEAANGLTAKVAGGFGLPPRPVRSPTGRHLGAPANPRRSLARQQFAETAVLCAADIAACAGALIVAVAALGWRGASQAADANWLVWFAMATAAVILYLGSHGHYTRRPSRATEWQDTIAAAAAAVLATTLITSFLQPDWRERTIILAWAISPVAILGLRGVARFGLVATGNWKRSGLLVADPSCAANATAAILAASHMGYDIVATIAPGSLAMQLATGDWHQILDHHNAQVVVVAYSAGKTEAPSPQMVEDLVRQRVPLAMLRPTGGLPAAGLEHHWLPQHDAVMLSYATTRDKPVSRFAKSALDISCAGVALVILLPLLAAIAVLIKLDGGPVLFAHRRIGLGGRPFHCLKFRTMVQDSEAVLARLLAEDADAAQEWAATQKLRNDPRVTMVGRLLRKTSLDELPQLINVMCRDMSLVGPRPIVSREIPRYGEDIAYYYEARPGITGLWQISGRNDTTYAKRVELDRWYVKNWTVSQDLAILARTIPAVVSGRGAS
jgi:undecaprenyl-phosphate galactose phosphotransferase